MSAKTTLSILWEMYDNRQIHVHSLKALGITSQ